MSEKQKKNLENQIEFIKNYCFQNGVILRNIYEDIASGMKLHRENLMILIKEINYKFYNK